MNQKYDDQMEELLEKPCWVIDFLPRQVPAESAGQYFAVEEFLMSKPQLEELYSRFARLLLKCHCYYDFVLGEGETWTENQYPEELWKTVIRCAESGYCCILVLAEHALITLSGGDLYMTLYDPSEELLKTVKLLAEAEGLFVRFVGEG